MHDFALTDLLLSDNPNLMRLTNGIGETVLHWLAIEGDVEAVKWLQEHGADMNTRNGFGTPVIFEVALLGYSDLLRWLFANGTDPLQKDADGHTLQEYLSEYGNPQMARVVEEIIANHYGGG